MVRDHGVREEAEPAGAVPAKTASRSRTDTAHTTASPTPRQLQSARPTPPTQPTRRTDPRIPPSSMTDEFGYPTTPVGCKISVLLQIADFSGCAPIFWHPHDFGTPYRCENTVSLQTGQIPTADEFAHPTGSPRRLGCANSIRASVKQLRFFRLVICRRSLVCAPTSLAARTLVSTRVGCAAACSGASDLDAEVMKRSQRFGPPKLRLVTRPTGSSATASRLRSGGKRPGGPDGACAPSCSTRLGPLRSRGPAWESPCLGR
jgi:hypothetical protein